MNRQAKYYTPPGSYDGAIKIGGTWKKVNELNRIDKSDWIRWQGPPSLAIRIAIGSMFYPTYRSKDGLSKYTKTRADKIFP